MCFRTFFAFGGAGIDGAGASCGAFSSCGGFGSSTGASRGSCFVFFARGGGFWSRGAGSFGAS